MTEIQNMQAIIGIGVDIEKNTRILGLIEKWGDPFLQRVFTPVEIDYCKDKKDSGGSYTARFAAKEAVFKAIGTGLRDGYKWTDIEVQNDEKGKPFLVFFDKTKQTLADKTVFISLSHTKEESIAFVVITDQS